ncbi:MAG: hypothetical protein FADNKDHG_00524 [Holosporales bacterium]
MRPLIKEQEKSIRREETKNDSKLFILKHFISSDIGLPPRNITEF